MLALPTNVKMLGARILYQGAKVALFLQGKSGSRHVVTRHNIKYELDLEEGIDLSIFVFGAFEKSTSQTLRTTIRPSQTVLDIGANIGAHTMTMAEAVGNKGRVIAIEATDWAYTKLLKNISLNPHLESRIIPLQYLLTHDISAETPRELYSSWNVIPSAEQHSVHKGKLKSTASARVVRLDSIIQELNIDNIDFIKIDVDGFEYWVLLGAADILKQYSPTILIELSPYVHLEHGSSFEALVQLLYKYNYRFYSVEDGTLLPKIIKELTAMIPKNGGINVIARKLFDQIE